MGFNLAFKELTDFLATPFI